MFGDVHVVSLPFHRGLRGATVNLRAKYQANSSEVL